MDPPPVGKSKDRFSKEPLPEQARMEREDEPNIREALARPYYSPEGTLLFSAAQAALTNQGQSHTGNNEASFRSATSSVAATPIPAPNRQNVCRTGPSSTHNSVDSSFAFPEARCPAVASLPANLPPADIRAGAPETDRTRVAPSSYTPANVHLSGTVASEAADSRSPCKTAIAVVPPATPSKKDRDCSRTPSPRKYLGKVNARVDSISASSSIEFSCMSSTPVFGGTPEGLLSRRGSITSSTCGDLALTDSRAITFRDTEISPSWESASESPYVPFCPLPLSTAATAVESLASILEHISQHIVDQPLLFALLTPAVHLLLQILPPLVHSHHCCSQSKPMSGVRLPAAHVLKLLSRKAAELLVSLEPDLCCSGSSRYTRVQRARPSHAYLKQRPHHQAQQMLQRSTHIFAASKWGCMKGFCKQMRGGGEQWHGPPCEAEKHEQTQSQPPRRPTYRTRTSKCLNPTCCCYSVGAKCTASSGEICCRVPPAELHFRVRRSCSNCPCRSASPCRYTCCGLFGCCQVQHIVPSRALESIIRRGRSNLGTNTSYRHQSNRRRRAKNDCPLSVLTSGSRSSGEYSRRRTQSGTCQGTTKASLSDGLLTCSQRDGLKAGLRRLLHIAKAAERTHGSRLERLFEEQHRGCWSMPSGSSAKVLPWTLMAVRDKSSLAGVSSRFFVHKDCACNPCGKGVTQASLENLFDGRAVGIAPSSSPCLHASDTLVFRVAAEATPRSATHSSGGGTASVAIDPVSLPGICPTEGAVGSFVPNTRERCTCLQGSGECSKQLLTSKVPSDNSVSWRFSQERWLVRQSQRVRSFPVVQTQVLVLLQKDALLPLHLPRLLTCALQQRRCQRHIQQRMKILQHIPSIICGGAVTHGRSKGRCKAAGTRSVSLEMEFSEMHVRQKRELENSLREGSSTNLTPVILPQVCHCVSKTEANTRHRRCLDGCPSFSAVEPRSHGRRYSHAGHECKAKPRGSAHSPSSASDAGSLSSGAHPAPMAATLVANEDWLRGKDATPAVVLKSQALYVKCFTATPCHRPPTFDAEERAAGPAYRGATEVSADVRIRDDAHHGVPPQDSSGCSPDFCTPMLCSRYEPCGKSGVLPWALEADQRTESHPVRATELRKELRPSRVGGGPRRQRSCTIFPQEYDDLACCRWQSPIAGGTTVDGLLSHTEQAVQPTLRTVTRYNVHLSGRGTVYSAGEAHFGKHSEESFSAAGVSTAPGASLTATAESPWLVAAFDLETQKGAQMPVEQEESGVSVSTPGGAPATLHFRTSASAAGAFENVRLSASTTTPKSSPHAHLQARNFSSVTEKSAETRRWFQEVTTDKEVVDNESHYVWLLERSVRVDNSPGFEGNPVDNSGVGCGAVAHSASIDFSDTFPAALSQPFPLFRVVSMKKAGSSSFTTCFADPHPSLAEKRRCAFVPVRSGITCRPPREPLLSTLRVKQRCSRQCSTRTASTTGPLNARSNYSATIDTNSSFLYSDNPAESQSRGVAARALGDISPWQSTSLKSVAAYGPASAQSIMHAPTTSLPVRSCDDSREEIQQQQVLRRRTPQGPRQRRAVTSEMSLPTATSPLAHSIFSPSQMLRREPKTCIVRKLSIPTDAEETMVGRTRQEKTPVDSVAPRLHHCTRTRRSFGGLPVTPQDCRSKDFANEHYIADCTSRERRARPPHILWESTTSAAVNSRNRGCNPSSHGCRSEATLRVWPKFSRDGSPPLFFSLPEGMNALLHPEKRRSSRVKIYLENKKTMEQGVVGAGLNSGNCVVAPFGDTPRNCKAQDPRSQCERAVHGEQEGLAPFAGNSSVVQASQTNCGKTSTFEDVVCPQAERLLHRVYRLCYELRRLTQALRKPCQCGQPFSLQSFVTAVPTTISQSHRGPTRPCGNLPLDMMPLAPTLVSASSTGFVAASTLRKELLPIMLAHVHTAAVHRTPRVSRGLTDSASVVTLAPKIETSLKVQEERVIESSPSHLEFVGDVNRKNSFAKWKRVRNATHQHDAVPVEFIDGRIISCSDVSTARTAHDVHVVSSVLRAAPCEKPQSTIPMPGDGSLLQPIAAHTTARLTQMFDNEERANQLLRRRRGRRVHCCVDRLLFQQRTICYRALHATARELDNLIYQHCTAVTSLSRFRNTSRTDTFDFAACKQHTATSTRLLSLLLQFTSFINSFSQTGDNRYCWREGRNFMPSSSKAGNAVQWQQQPQRKNLLFYQLQLRSPHSSKLRSKMGHERGRKKLQAICLTGRFARTKRRKTCRVINNEIARAFGQLLLRLCGMLLDALCRCAAVATALPCPYEAGKVGTSFSLHKIDALQCAPRTGKLLTTCKSEKSGDYSLRATDGIYAGGHRNRSVKQKNFAPSRKEGGAHRGEMMNSYARTGHQSYRLVLTSAEGDSCFNRQLSLMPCMREPRHNLSATAHTTVVKQRTEQGEAAFPAGEKAPVIRDVLPEISARQLAAARPAGGFCVSGFHALPLAKGDTIAYNGFAGQNSKELITERSAAEFSLSASASEFSSQLLSSTKRVNPYVRGVPAADVALQPAVRHLHYTVDCIAEILLDSRMPCTFINTMPQVLSPHKHVHVFPHLLQRVLCGALIQHSPPRADASASSCAASSPARSLAMPSCSAFLGRTLPRNSVKRGRFCRANLQGSIPTGRAKLWELALAGRLLPLPSVKQSAAHTGTPPCFSTGGTILHGSGTEFVPLSSDARGSSPGEHRLRAFHLPRSAGASLFQLAALPMHTTKGDTAPATCNYRFQKPPYLPCHSSALQHCFQSSQNSPSVDLLDLSASGPGLLLFHTAVDFSVCPWTACLNLATDKEYRASSIPSIYSESNVHILTYFEAMTRATHAAIPHNIISAPAASPTLFTPDPASWGLVTVLPPVCSSSTAHCSLISLPDAPSCPYAFSPKITLCRAPPSTPTSRNDAFAGSVPEKSFGSNVVSRAAVHPKPCFPSDVPAPGARKPTVAGRVNISHIPPLLKMFKIKQWITAVEKKQQHRLMNNESKCVLLARVTADLLLHTLQRHQTFEKCGGDGEQLHWPRTALLSNRTPAHAASVPGSVMPGRQAAENHPTLHAGHPAGLSITSASVAFRIGAISLLFAPNAHGEHSGEAAYQLCLCMLASCISSPVPGGGLQAACFENHMHAQKGRKTVSPHTPRGDSHPPTQSGADRPLPTVLAFNSPNSEAASIPAGKASCGQHISSAMKYNYPLTSKGATTCIRRAKGWSHTDANTSGKRTVRRPEEANPSELKRRLLSTCCEPAHLLRLHGGAAARRVSLQLLLKCLGLVPELLSALLPVLLFCVPVHLFHSRLPRSLLRLLYLHVKQGQFIGSCVAIGTPASGSVCASYSTFPRTGSAFPGRKCTTATGESSFSADPPYVPHASHVSVAPLSSTARAIHAAASSADAFRTVPAGQIAVGDTLEQVEFGEISCGPPQQRTKTRHIIDSGAAAEYLWMQLLKYVTKGPGCAHFAEKTSLLHYGPLLQGRRAYQDNCVPLHVSALAVLRRLTALLPSMVFSYSCSRSWSHGGRQNSHKQAPLKLSEQNLQSRSLHETTRLLDERRAAEGLRQIKIACALFRMLLRRAVGVALDKHSENRYPQCGESTIAEDYKGAVRPHVMSKGHQFATGGGGSNRRTKSSEGQIEKLEKDNGLQSQRFSVGDVGPTPSETKDSSESSEVHASVTRAKTTGELRPSCTRAEKTAALLVVASRQAVNAKTTPSTHTPDILAEQKSFNEAPTLKLHVGSCGEVVYGRTLAIGTLHKQLEKTLSGLLVRAAVSAVAECTFFSKYAHYRRYGYAASSLMGKYRNMVSSARKMASQHRYVSPVAAFSLESSHAGSSKPASRASIGRYTPSDSAQTERRLGALEKFAVQARRSVPIGGQASSGDTHKSVPRSTRIPSLQKVKRSNGCTGCRGVLRTRGTSVQQQLISAFEICVVRAFAKPSTKQAAQFIRAAWKQYAHDVSASGKVSASSIVVGEASASRQGAEQQRQREDRLLAWTIPACAARIHRSADLIMDRQHPQQCLHRAKGRVTSVLIPVSDRSSGCKYQRLPLTLRTNRVNATNKDGQHRTFLVGWHLLQTCIQAMKMLPIEDQQTTVVCRALRRLSDRQPVVPNSACTVDKSRARASFPCDRREADRRESSTYSTVLQPRVPCREDGTSLASAAEASYFERGASTMMPVATAGRNTSSETVKASRTKAVRATLTTARCTRPVSHVQPDALTVLDAKWRTGPPPVSVLPLKKSLVPTSTKPTLFPHPAVAANLPVRGSSRLQRQATNIAGCRGTTYLLSGAISSTKGRTAPIGVQMMSANTVKTEDKAGYNDVFCRVRAGGQGFEVRPLKGETVCCSIMDCVDELEKRRARLRYKLLLAAITLQHVAKKNGSFFCVGSIVNEHLRQQVKQVCSGQPGAFKERCCATAALVLHSRLAMQCVSPLQFVPNVDRQKIHLPTDEVASGGFVAGTLVSQKHEHDCGQRERNGHASPKQEVDIEEARKIKLRLLTRRRKDRFLGNAPVRGNKSDDVAFLEQQDIPLSTGASTQCDTEESQLGTVESYPQVFTAGIGRSGGASKAGNRCVTHNVSCADVAACRTQQPRGRVYLNARKGKAHQDGSDGEMAVTSEAETTPSLFSCWPQEKKYVFAGKMIQQRRWINWCSSTKAAKRRRVGRFSSAKAQPESACHASGSRKKAFSISGGKAGKRTANCSLSLLSRRRTLKQSPASAFQRRTSSPILVTASSAGAQFRTAVVSPRTRVAAAARSIHNLEPATHTLDLLPFTQSAKGTVATDALHISLSRAEKRHTQEVDGYEEKTQRASTVGYIISTERAIKRGNAGEMTTSPDITGVSRALAAGVETSFKFPKEISLLDAAFSSGEGSVRDPYRGQDTDPSPSSLFHLSSSSFSVCDTPRKPCKFAFTAIAHEQPALSKTDPLPQVCAVKTEVYSTNHPCRSDVGFLTTAPRADIKTNLRQRYRRFPKVPAYPQRKSLWAQRRKELHYPRQRKRLARLHQHKFTSLLRVDKQKSAPEVTTASSRGYLQSFDAIDRQPSPQISGEKTRQRMQSRAALQRNSPSDVGRQKEGQLLMLHPSAPAGCRKLVTTAPISCSRYLKRVHHAIVYAGRMHIHVKPIIPVLLTNIKRTHQCKEAFENQDQVLDKRSVQPELRGRVQTSLVGRARRLDKSWRFSGAKGGRSLASAVGASLQWRGSSVRLKRQSNAFEQRSLGTTSTQLGSYTGTAGQLDVVALPPTRAGQILMSAHAISGDMHIVTQNAKQCLKKAVSYFRAQRQSPCYRPSGTRSPGPTHLFHMQARYRERVSDTLLASSNCKHGSRVIATGPLNKTTSQAHQGSFAGMCAPMLATPSRVLHDATEYSSVLAGRRCGPVMTFKGSGYSGTMLLRPLKERKPEAIRDIPLPLSQKIAGVDPAQHPRGTFLLCRQTAYLLCASRPQKPLVRSRPSEPCLRENVTRFILPRRVLQKQLSKRDICLVQKGAAKEAHMQASSVRKARGNFLPASVGPIQRQPLITTMFSCVRPEVCNHVADVGLYPQSAVSQALLTAHRAETSVAFAVITTCSAVRRPCTCPHQGRLQHNACLSETDLRGHLSNTSAPCRCIGQKRRKQALVRRQLSDLWCCFAYPVFPKTIPVKGDLLTVHSAVEKEILCIFINQRSCVPSHTRRAAFQRFCMSPSGHGKTGVRNRVQWSPWGEDGPTSRPKNKPEPSFRGIKRGFRESEQSLVWKSLIVTRQAQLEKLILDQEHLPLAVPSSSAPVRTLLIAHICGASGMEAHIGKTRKNSSRQKCVNIVGAVSVQPLPRGAQILPLWGTQKSAVCCRRQLPHPGPREQVANQFDHAIPIIHETLVILKCLEAVCNTPGCWERVRKLGNEIEKYSSVDDAEAQQCGRDIDLRGQHVAAIQKSADIPLENTTNSNVRLRAECVGPEAGAVSSLVTNSFNLHQCLCCGNLQAQRQQWILTAGSPLKHSSMSFLLSEEPDDGQMKMTLCVGHGRTGAAPRLRLSGHHTQSGGTVTAAGYIGIKPGGLDPTTMAAVLYDGRTTRQLCFGETAVVLRSTSREAAATVGHTLSAPVKSYATRNPTFAAARRTAVDTVLNDSLFPCEEGDEGLDNELVSRRSSFELKGTKRATIGPRRLQNCCSWTEIESAVHPWQGDEGGQNSPCSEWPHVSEDEPGAVRRPDSQNVHVCGTYCGNALSPATSIPLIRCVSTLFDTQPSQQAGYVRLCSPQESPPIRAHTEAKFPAAARPLPHCLGALELPEPLISTQPFEYTTRRVPDLLSVGRSACPPRVVSLRQERGPSERSCKDARRRRKHARAASTRTFFTSSKTKRIRRFSSALLCERNFCKAGAQLNVGDCKTYHVVLKIKVRCT